MKIKQMLALTDDTLLALSEDGEMFELVAVNAPFVGYQRYWSPFTCHTEKPSFDCMVAIITEGMLTKSPKEIAYTIGNGANRESFPNGYTLTKKVYEDGDMAFWVDIVYKDSPGDLPTHELVIYNRNAKVITLSKRYFFDSMNSKWGQDGR